MTYKNLPTLALAIMAAAMTLATPAAAAEKVYKIVMHSDLKSLDPIWNGSYIVRNFGYLIYDTLFAIDEKFQVKPQMAESWSTSSDGLVTTIKLRLDLK